MAQFEKPPCYISSWAWHIPYYWEGKYIQEFLGQSGEAVAYKLVEVLAKGRAEGSGRGRKKVFLRGYGAILSRPDKWERGLKKEEEWLLSGYALDTDGYHHILEVKAKAEITDRG